MEIFIVDDHPLMRLGIKTFLGAAQDVRIVGECAEGEEALWLVEAARPDLVILGLNPAGDVDGVGLCREIKALADPPRVLVHTAYNFPDDLASCFLAKADGFLHKSIHGETLLDAVRATAAGRGPWLAGERIGESRSRVEATPEGVELTQRERQVLGLILHRYSNPEIAEALHLGEQTVKNYASSTFKKFGVRNRRELFMKTSLPAG